MNFGKLVSFGKLQFTKAYHFTKIHDQVSEAKASQRCHQQGDFCVCLSQLLAMTGRIDYIHAVLKAINYI